MKNRPLYYIEDQDGLIMDACPTRQSAIRSIDVLEASDKDECCYQIGEYTIVHPNGMKERIWNLPSPTFIGNGAITDEYVKDGVTVP